MKSLILFGVAVALMYLGFFLIDHLDQDHWAYFPTCFTFGVLVLFHLQAAIVQGVKGSKCG